MGAIAYRGDYITVEVTPHSGMVCCKWGELTWRALGYTKAQAIKEFKREITALVNELKKVS